ncbi:methyltransferase [Bradyrhizobium sp. CCBAU 53338]|uniref:methyltransferase n=1 Tax=Bradyrhizobium sp. CCBAU 53338 TaxID=1325111 RepID=UPI00188D0466|nr:methyltransferase [Bradyrhizobium sp. CCBAU 53338]QOZ51673.1 SAM-dependent methyltransferase [Bradyrhizobium sp. CCBAU 53338]
MADISPDLFMDAVLAYQQTAAIKAALELDLFSEIGKGSATAENLARATGSAARGVRILCDYLTARGHLEKHGDQYQLTESTAAFLDRSAPSWMGSVVEYLTAPEMMALFLSDPPAFVRNGGSIGLANNAPDHPIWVKFARAMGPSRVPLAKRIASELAVSSPRKVLDVAAGHGMFGIAIAQAVVDAQITAVDWDAVLSVAQQNADAAGVSGRYRILGGSAFDTDWGSGFDLVLLANFLHQLDKDGCVTLLRKARKSLVSGGRAVAVEFLLNEDRVSPRFSAMFAFQMLGSTPHGDTYTVREFEEMGRAAGFARVTAKSLPPTPQSLLLFEQA